MLTGNSVYREGQFENPGPAPRPPPGGPRLGLMPATAGVPGNSSHSNLQSLANRSVVNVNGSSDSSPSLSRSTTMQTAKPTSSNNETLVAGGVSIVKEGPARVKDGLMWKKRYLILRSWQIDFHKDKDGKVVGSISLKDIVNVSRSENVKLSFEILRVAKPESNILKEPYIPARDLPQKSTIVQVETDDEIYNWIDAIVDRCPGMGGVSNPTNFKHRVHVGFDEVNGNFTGLPKEWEQLLSSSTLTKEDYKKNPQVLLEVVGFYHDLKKRGENPDAYASGMPTPPAMQKSDSSQGYVGAGAALLPPRPPPPTNYNPSRPSTASSPDSRSTTPGGSNRNVSNPEQINGASNKLGMDSNMRQMMEEEARRVKQAQEQKQRDRQREEEEATRREQEAYEASLPKQRVPRAQQEIGGGGYSRPAEERNDGRYNPLRNAPPTPSNDRARQQPQGSLRGPTPQRQAPHAPGSSNPAQVQPPRAPYAHKPGSSRDQSPSTEGSLRNQPKPEQSRYQGSSSRQPPGRDDQRKENGPMNGYGSSPTHKLPVRPQQPQKQAGQTAQQPAPLNVKPGASKDEARAHGHGQPAKAGGARQREARMSNMTEAQVMEKLKQVVSKDDPSVSYTKQKKIGQGASGSVYVARINESAKSAIARNLYRTHGPRAQVAIKQMDLRNQPRKELIVNEIIVMQESSHPNIVNFLDSFLQESNNELWVVMEFMEGGALTDVIDNNPNITEAQMATVCREVCARLLDSMSQSLIILSRLAVV